MWFGMDPLWKDEDLVYGASIVRVFLMTFYGVVMSDHELKQKLREIIEDKGRKEERDGRITGPSDIDDFNRGSKVP